MDFLKPLRFYFFLISLGILFQRRIVDTVEDPLHPLRLPFELGVDKI